MCIFFFILSINFASEDQLELESDGISYSEDQRILIASPNVTLRVGDASIQTDILYLDVDQQEAWGSGNVVIRRGSNILDADRFRFDFDSKRVSVSNTRFAVTIPDATDHIYFHADHLEDEPHQQRGVGGIMTTCDLDHPHYYLRAERFDHVMGEHIFGKNVLISSPILGIPFYFWTPYYLFSLGERKLIWNFPTIGQKNTPGWGWFMQNTIDYDLVNGKESSIYLDFFQFKGVGVGARHRYRFGGEDTGTLYGYYFEEQDTGDLNTIFSWDHHWHFTPYLTMTSSYRHANAERINTQGIIDEEEKNIRLLYDKLGDIYDIKASDFQNRQQNFRTINLNVNRRFNHETPYTFTYNQQDNNTLENRTISSTLVQRSTLLSDIPVQTTLQYQNRTDFSNNDDIIDDQLRSTIKLSYSFDPHWDMDIILDHFVDLDQNRVTTDSRSNANNFLFKHPELNLRYRNNDLWGVTWSNDITLGRYQEVQYDRSLDEQIRFPENSEFGADPNVYIFKNTWSKQVTDLPFKSTFSLTGSYDQYIFKTPGFSLSDGDSFYSIFFRPSIKSDWFGFLESATSYEQRYIPSEGNSPFLSSFRPNQSESHLLSQSFKFYLESPTTYYWRHSVSYDFQRERWNIYTTTLFLAPNDDHRITISTGVDINRLNTYLDNRNEPDGVRFRNSGIFRPLTWTIHTSPIEGHSIRFNHSQDVNRGTLINSHININSIIGSNKDYQWAIEAQFVYDKNGIVREMDVSRYDLDTIKIIKSDHCRTFTFSYNRRLEEYRFYMTINAFPNEKIGYKQTPAVSKIEGVFDEGSVERF